MSEQQKQQQSLSPSTAAAPVLVSACSSVSEAAYKFMTESYRHPWKDVDLSPEGVAALRAENSEAARDGCRAVREQTGVTIDDDSVINGVSVQFVIPKDEPHGNRIVVLFLFGGAFIVGCPEDDLSITARLATYLGCRVCVPRYRLAPEHTFPAAQDDVMAVYHGLHDGKRKILVVGESAGGNLALSTTIKLLCKDAQREQEENLPLCCPAALALMSPWIDLTHSGDSHKILAHLDPTLSVPHFLEPASAKYANGVDRASPAISPLFFDPEVLLLSSPSSSHCPSPPFPPTIISTATRDLLMSDSTRLAAKLRSLRGRGLSASSSSSVELLCAEGLFHVYEFYPQFPEADASIRAIAQSLLRHVL